LAISLLCYFSVSLIFHEDPQPKEVIPFISLNGSGVAIVDEQLPSLLRQELIEKEHRIELYEFSDLTKLYVKDQEYYIKDENSDKEPVKINPDFPLILDNGAYLYFYHDRFKLENKEFEELSLGEGSCLRDGKVYYPDGLSAEKMNFFLLKLPNGLYMNSEQLILEHSASQVEIEKNSVIYFGENYIAYCSLSDHQPDLKKEIIEDSLDMLSISGNRMTYDSFMNRMNPAAETIQGLPFELVLEDPIYQYFLGNRYDYSGTKKLFWSKKGYICEQEGSRFYLPSTPVYFKEDKKLMLPCDYTLLQPKLFLTHKLPAMTQITAGEGAFYTAWSDVRMTYSDIIAFDGVDTYLF
jgi:hypothetical protein